MKVLFCGLGSIGQRHLRNLLQLKKENLEIMAYRTRGLQITLNDDLTVANGVKLDEKYNIRCFASLDLALLECPDIVFITNPSSMHLETLREVVGKSSADIFIEKPLAHTLDGLSEIFDAIKRSGITVFVGFQNRFHPCVKTAKQLLDTGCIGRVISANIEIGEYMPHFHKYEDYRGLYASKKELGGGVILTQIHEIDYAYHLFGKPQSVYAVGGKLSDLEIDVEDTASILLGYDRNGIRFPVHIHVDFLQNPPARGCKIIGTRGRIEFNLLGNSLVCYGDSGDVVCEENYAHFSRNDMFLEELRLFFAIREGRAKKTLTIEDGMASLEIALAAKASMESGAPVLFEAQ